MKRKLLITLSVLAFIPALNFTLGTIRYFRGNGAILRKGYPVFEPLDRGSRAWTRTAGCVEYGIEPLTLGSNNAALKLWTTLLGYQNGTYHGFYPNGPDAFSIVEADGKDVDVATTETGYQFDLDGKTIKLSRIGSRELALDHRKAAKATIVDDELVIIEPDSKILYLADKNTGTIFAEY